MDNILLVDLRNQVYRSNITFGVKEHYLNLAEYKCACGHEWNKETESCDLDYVIIFNFFRNLRPLVEQFIPDKCFFVLEGHPKFRYDLYPGYKADRLIKYAAKASTQKKISNAEKIIIELALHLGITIARAKNYEADDLIGTLASELRDESVSIISSDTDFIQLLQQGYENIQIYNPIKKEFAQAPEYSYLVFKSLFGDKADSIPRLLSEKKTKKLLNSPELFEEWINLEENRANFTSNKNLITLAQVPSNEIEIQEGMKNYDLLKVEFQKMKFESLLTDFTWARFTETFNSIKF